MPSFELGLNHRDILLRSLRSVRLLQSEYSFSNLYLFRNEHRYRLEQEGGFFCITGQTYDKKKYVMPLQNLPEASPGYFDFILSFLSPERMLYPVPEAWLPLFPEDKFSRVLNENDSDYLYDSEKIQTFAGKKMQKKRNLFHQFTRRYAAVEESDIKDCTREAVSLLDHWHRLYDENIRADYVACREALGNPETLGLEGKLFRVEGKPVGFILGEPLNEEVYAFHFAKGDRDIKGVYQYIYSRYAREHCRNFRYINMEQDMGLESLRKSKRSYYPSEMGHKYRIYPRCSGTVPEKE